MLTKIEVIELFKNAAISEESLDPKYLYYVEYTISPIKKL